MVYADDSLNISTEDFEKPANLYVETDCNKIVEQQDVIESIDDINF